MANALQDILQSASNALASNVSGPVDMLGWGLRKIGVPVPENAVGSSEWMRERGLTRDVPQGFNQLAGETIGLVAPFSIAAKAPQIAGGLLRAGENAAIPRTMNQQKGAVDLKLFHGTQRAPSGISEFGSGPTYWGKKPSKDGGLWMTSSPDEASSYANWVKGTGNPTVYPINARFKNPASLDDLEKLGIYGDPQMVLYEAKNIAKLKKAGYDGVVWDMKTYTGQAIPESENTITAFSIYPQRMKSQFEKPSGEQLPGVKRLLDIVNR